MGLDAAVHCNCFADGKTSVPPVPVEWLTVDEYTGELSTSDEWDGTDDDVDAFDRWQENGACTHSNMFFADASLGSYGSVAELETYLDRAGGVEQFPLLHSLLLGESLPIEASDAGRFIEELDLFEKANDSKHGEFISGLRRVAEGSIVTLNPLIIS